MILGDAGEAFFVRLCPDHDYNQTNIDSTEINVVRSL